MLQMMLLIDNRSCHIMCSGNTDTVVYLGIHSNGKEQAEKIKHELDKRIKDYSVVAYEANEWFADYSPWKAPAAFGDTNFAGNGKNTLEWLIKHCIYECDKEMACTFSRRMLAGYSLAGLFSLWALYESDIFDGGAICSGSLWFPGWERYISTNNIKRYMNIYLSLGTKEEKTKNSVMSSVGDMTRKQYEIFKNNEYIKHTVLEWNNGGHFTNPEERIAKGIAWLYTQR